MGWGLQAFNCWDWVPSLVWKQIPQAKQLQENKKTETKTKHTPQDAFKFYKNYYNFCLSNSRKRLMVMYEMIN